jgi:DNA-binding CsgD family transcriptional regulator/tetratricopeptide (TPR) repeat protein
MIGRTNALAQLRDLFDATSISEADLPAVALIAGEAGIGKSRLLREFVATLPAGTQLLFSYGDPGAVDRSLSLLSELVPSPAPATPDGLQEVTEQLRRLVTDRRTVVVLEDLHWADADSVWVIDRLVTRPWPNVIIIGTYRPDDLSRRLPGGDLLSRLERRTDVERIHLERLNRLDVAAFLSAVYDEAPASAVIEALYNRTGGNPFFLEELLASSGAGTASELVAMPLPWSLEEVVQRQLDGLAPAERHVAEVAAVCGPSSRFDVLAEVAELDEADLIGLLRRLIDRDLLIEGTGELFVFRHALVRDAVEGSLLRRQRTRLHERALAALQAVDAPPDELARHALGAGHYEEFVDLARAGAEQFLEAGRTFSALRLADEALGEVPDDLVMLFVAARSAWLAGLTDEAVGYATRWVAAADATGDPDALAPALRWAARIEFDRDHHEEEEAHMERLARLMPELSILEQCRALAWTAQIHMLRHRLPEAIEVADRAIELAERIGAKDVAVQARIERGSALVFSRGVEAAGELLRAIDDAEAADEWVLVTRGLNNVFDAVHVASPEGRLLLERFKRAAERGGFDVMATNIAALRFAELAHNEADMESCRRMVEPVYQSWAFGGKHRGWLKLWDFQLAMEEGRVANAGAHLAQIGAGSCELEEHTTIERLRLRHAAAAGETERGRAAVAVIVTGPLDRSANAPNDIVDIVDHCLRLGMAPDEVRSVIVVGWLGEHPALERVSSIVEGLLLAEEGRPAESAARLLTGLATPDPSLPKYVVEYLRTAAAAQVMLSGDKTGARALVAQAVDGLSRWPGWRRDRAEALARRLDGSTGGDGVLSAREREVAALLTEGITNAELARRLYISPKTAAVHVSNILMKLNMSSRAEIAAWDVRTGLVGD